MEILWITTVLDQDSNFINAVRVTARREDTPIILTFARIFGKEQSIMARRAVAWIGFAGTFAPGDLDIPLAICDEWLGHPPVCGVTVTMEQGENAIWSNLEQPDQNEDGSFPDTCTSGNDNDVLGEVPNGNTRKLYLGVNIGVNNGTLSNVYDAVKAKWEANSMVEGHEDDTSYRKVYPVTLPVVKCFDESGHDLNTCAPLVGGITVNLHWVTDNTNLTGNNSAYSEVPYYYYSSDGVTELWHSSTTDNVARWHELATFLELLNEDGTPIDLGKYHLYFEASCEAVDPVGGVGGNNYGTLSRRPVLVK